MHVRLGVHGDSPHIDEVCRRLASNSTALSLTLEESRDKLRHEYVVKISSMMCLNWRLLHLCLSNIMLDADDVPEIVRIIKYNSTLISLDVRGNNFVFEDAKPIIRAVSDDNRTLHSFKIDITKRNEELYTQFFFMLSINDVLEEVDLTWEEFEGDDAFVDAICAILRDNVTLKDIGYVRTSTSHVCRIVRSIVDSASLDGSPGRCIDACHTLLRDVVVKSDSSNIVGGVGEQTRQKLILILEAPCSDSTCSVKERYTRQVSPITLKRLGLSGVKNVLCGNGTIPNASTMGILPILSFILFVLVAVYIYTIYN